MISPNYNIYDASAGSGKTFTLVKSYLKILFTSQYHNQFQYILAITFTNKAVAEMKERIIDTLTEFANEDILSQPNTMFKLICEELDFDAKSLHYKSKNILNHIVHNYAAFDVSTIDGFTHKIIRTFAHDLKLPLNFEVELDQNALLSEAVDALIAKAGNDKALTKILVDFAIEKADDDKSWDIAFDFNKIAKLLVSERDIPFIDALKDKSSTDFEALKQQLKNDLKKVENQIIETAKNVLTLIEECGLEFDDFSRASLPKHFQNLSQKKIDINFSSAWQNALIENLPLYPKRVTEEIASIVNEIQPQLISAFNTTKKQVFQLKFLKAFYKNITPLSVLNYINQELIQIKQEQNKILISEFNTIISKEIKDQPTPFIYERIGEKFKHYFIDEFQDTSELQWQNLIPLIDNALSGQNLKEEQGTAMLVGDAKQAIYRWRGGKAEQFIDLFNKTASPFHLQPTVNDLSTNYRSFKEIVTFNNSFFNHLSEHVFSQDDYSNLYANGSKQNINLNKSGYVNISFLELQREDNRDEIYPKEVLETILKCSKNNYNYKDICVLVRKRKEGVAIAEILSANQIPIMSSETMLISNSSAVNFINNILKLLIQPSNNEVKVEALSYVSNKFKIEDKHEFFETHLKLSPHEFFKSFEDFSVHINHDALLQLPLYELAETIVRAFTLVEKSDAYIQFYLDFVLEFSQKKGSDISGFLNHFEKKKDSLSIVSPKNQDAVQIMTIHKSKGLEFPVVIFPYADLDIYRENEPKEWFPVEAENYNGFSNTLLNYSKDFENYGDVGQTIYSKHQSELELDNINLLYVALTRPIEQLYIISKKDISAKGVINTKTYSGLLLQYLNEQLLFVEDQQTYTFGKFERYKKGSEHQDEITTVQEFISTAKESHQIKIVTNSGFLWDTKQQEALEKGNLIHGIMSQIKTKNEIDFALYDFMSLGIITEHQAEVLKQNIIQIIDHPELKEYYTSAYTIYNERDIISKSGTILRPDRLVINSKNEAIIIDYKTGLHNPKYEEQLQDYQDIIEEMEFKVINKILIYINNDLKIQYY